MRGPRRGGQRRRRDEFATSASLVLEVSLHHGASVALDEVQWDALNEAALSRMTAAVLAARTGARRSATPAGVDWPTVRMVSSSFVWPCTRRSPWPATPSRQAIRRGP